MPYRLLNPSIAEAAPVVMIGAPLQDVGETLQSLRNTVFKETGKRTNLPDEQGGVLDQCINWAYRQMMASIKIKECYASFSITMVADQPFYLLPVQCASIRSVQLIDSSYVNGGMKLIPIDATQYSMLPDRDDDPRNYFRYGRGGEQMLVVYADPISDQDLAVDCRIRPDDLVDDLDSPILPTEFHDALRMLAKSKAFREVGDGVKERLAVKDYKDAIGDLISTDSDEDGEIPSGVQFIKDPKDLARIRTTSRRYDDDRG